MEHSSRRSVLWVAGRLASAGLPLFFYWRWGLAAGAIAAFALLSLEALLMRAIRGARALGTDLQRLQENVVAKHPVWAIIGYSAFFVLLAAIIWFADRT